MNNIKFSIIVPVYNVENYLRECLDSILNQTYKNFEIILVDDGSKDGSSQICDEYEDKDSRIKVIHKENGGLSDARNHGIEAATGDYLVFVDSDDWIELNSLENISIALNDSPEIIITTFIEYFENNHEKRINDKGLSDYLAERKMSKDDVVNWICWESKNTWPAQKYVVSRDYINRFNLRFLKGRLHEDMDWTSRCFYYGSRFAFMTEPWYYHRLNRESSITSSISIKHFIDMIEMANIHYECPVNVDQEIHNQLFRRFMCSTYAWLRYSRSCSIEQVDTIIECLENNKKIMKCAPKLWNKVFVLAYKVLGGKVAFKLLEIIR